MKKRHAYALIAMFLFLIAAYIVALILPGLLVMK